MKRISYNTVLGFFVLSTFWRKFIGRGKVVYCLLVCFGALVDLMVRVIRSFTGSLVSREPVDLFFFFMTFPRYLTRYCSCLLYRVSR